jgi:hypothetical protein
VSESGKRADIAEETDHVPARNDWYHPSGQRRSAHQRLRRLMRHRRMCPLILGATVRIRLKASCSGSTSSNYKIIV